MHGCKFNFLNLFRRFSSDWKRDSPYHIKLNGKAYIRLISHIGNAITPPEERWRRWMTERMVRVWSWVRLCRLDRCRSVRCTFESWNLKPMWAICSTFHRSRANTTSFERHTRVLQHNEHRRTVSILIFTPMQCMFCVVFIRTYRSRRTNVWSWFHRSHFFSACTIYRNALHSPSSCQS